jgi:hypothetical protein
MQFATCFDRPRYAPGFALTFGVQRRQVVYVERRYLNKAGTQLAVRSTPLQGPGLFAYREYQVPEGTHQIQVQVTTANNATEADPAFPVAVENSDPLFSTPFTAPVLFGAQPMHLSIGLSTTRQELYYEREYLDEWKQTLLIRSELIYDRGVMAWLPVSQVPPPYGTRWINACITGLNRGISVPAITREYTKEEHTTEEHN